MTFDTTSFLLLGVPTTRVGTTPALGASVESGRRLYGALVAQERAVEAQAAAARQATETQLAEYANRQDAEV